MLQNPVFILAALLTVIATVKALESRRSLAFLFSIIPSLVFYYFLPTLLNQIGLLPRQSPLYSWIKEYVLPASLVLLTLSLDVPAILKLGRKTVLMFLISSCSVMIGGPIALVIWKNHVPPDAWKALAYLAGSWIGGAANAVALARKVNATDAALSPVIVVDVIIAYSWMAVLMMLAARHARLDRWMGADRKSLAALHERIGQADRSVKRQLSITSFATLAAFGLAIAVLANAGAEWMHAAGFLHRINAALSLDSMAWKVVLATTVGVAMSLSPARRMESAGASKAGMLMLYLLVTVIGAGADFSSLRHAGGYLGLGATWMLIHIVILFIAGRMLRAPFFLVAVSSQANIGGPISAPIVAAAFNPALAPVGVLLAIAGYVLGTYAGLLCTRMCQAVAG